MTHPDLFDPPTPERVCGTCVTRNALPEDEWGCCSKEGNRHKRAEACGSWFPTIELKRALYGKTK